MATEGQVILNNNVTVGAAVAVVQDGSGRQHQEIIIQTQLGAADPVSISTSNPLPVTGAIADLAADSGNSVKIAGVFNTVAPTVGNGQRAPIQLDSSGNLKVNIAAGGSAGGTSSAVAGAAPGVATAVGFKDGGGLLQLGSIDGSGNIKVNIAAGGVPAGQDNTAFTSGTTQGLVGIYVADNTNGVGNITQGNQGVPKMTLDRKQWVAIGAQAQGGWTPSKITSAASTNATSVKASAGQLGTLYATNTGASFAYVKFYNKASAPTVGTDVPIQVYGLPPGGGGNIPLGAGLAFSTGIALAIVAGTGADTDVNAVALSQVQVNLGTA